MLVVALCLISFPWMSFGASAAHVLHICSGRLEMSAWFAICMRMQHCLGKKSLWAKLGLQIGATVVVKWQLLQSCCTSPRSSPQMVGSLIHVVNTNNGPSLEENLFDHLPHVRNTDVPRMGAAARGIRSRCIRVVMRAQLAPWSLLRTCEQSAMKK